MTTISKPKLSNFEVRCEAAKQLFLTTEFLITKETLAWHLDLDYPKQDRQIRDVISHVAKELPIISVSAKRGYRLAKDVDDLKDVHHAVAELASRIEELRKRKTQLTAFIATCNDIN